MQVQIIISEVFTESRMATKTTNPTLLSSEAIELTMEYGKAYPGARAGNQ